MALPLSSHLPSTSSPTPSHFLHVIPTSFLPPHQAPPHLHRISPPLRVRLTLRNTPLQIQESDEPSAAEKIPKPFKNSIWINPNNPRAPALRRNSADFRYARLAHLASTLDSSPADVPLLLSSLPTPTPEPEAVIILNNMENSSAALSALHWFLQNLKLQKEVILFNVTFKVLRKCRTWDDVEPLLMKMLDRGIQPDNITFSTLISCARVCDLPAKAVEWFEKMPEFGLSPDDVTYSAMIDAYGRLGKLEMALRLYDRARKEKWRLDPVTFATLIRVYGASGNFDGALNVFEEMKALGVKPNLVTYNKLLDVMGRAGRPWQVKNIHKEIISNKILPNRITYSALIRAYSQARYAADALTIYKEMRRQSMELNVVLYNMLLSMCADIGYIEEAVDIFEDMKGLQDTYKPDSWSYSSMITAYSCAGNVAEAEKMLNSMMEAGFQPTIFVLTSIIQCYGKAKRIDDVVRTFDRLSALGISPDDRFCGCLLNVLTQAPRNELGKVIELIERSNPQLGSFVTLMVDVGASEEVFQKEAEELFSSISEEVKKAYCNCLMDMCVNINQLSRASVLLKLALKLGIYSTLQSKSATQWSLHVRSLSHGAALTALHAWMNDMKKAMEDGEELPPLLGIHTGHGKHKYSERGLGAALEFHLRELNAPFHEGGDKIGWFLTTNIAAKLWLESRGAPVELVVA
ncbi:pentatricopeptide repeat-containing protein At4g16390, chloroplastic [Phalaenopsis equestris]|uniref:pentatricopeptide repeat-containing protein At4g16390, chloroplastic n=1 Tax=Phalaenopsis equestris TaxID=78828 RepID=UPI0009E46CDD|nr:pentatricopeptide repeat-containing protein At4g16390, chloroplastic [Phalaenopsis equestris]